MTQIGKYQILEQIGEGAMGVVYKATDPVLNRTVAIKVMNEGLAQDVSLRERFLREAQAAGSLQHPNLVTIYDFGETDGHLFIAMEHIEGADLEQLLTQRTPMPIPAKLDLIIDVLNGLSFAHRRGIIHRDIKPANIRIDQEGRARIMDFGVAKLEKSNLTGTGMMMGTPNYMAPEQITGTEELTPAADLWSVGAVLYELLGGKKPFGAETLHRVLFRIVSEPPTELLELNPDLPLALDHVVKRALEKDPSSRYANAAEFANALAAVRGRLAGGRASRTVSQRSSIEEHLKRAAQDKSPAGNRAMLPITLGVGIGLVLASVGVVVALKRDAPPADVQPPPTPTVSLTPNLTPPPPIVIQQTTPPAQTTTKSGAANPPRTTPAPANTASAKTAGANPAGANPASANPASANPAGANPAGANAAGANAAGANPPGMSQPQPVAPATPTLVVRDTTPPAANPPVTVPAPTPPPVAAAAPVDHRPAIASIVQAYARSIGTRSVVEVRRIYPGMTPQQQSGWESFFSSVRSIRATLEIGSLDISGATATAQLTGAYEYVSRAGRTETRPASFEAKFQREGDRWTLQTVR